MTGYIKAILGLIGIDNVCNVFAEGLAMGEDRHYDSIEEARDVITSLTGHTGQEVSHVNP